jgi:hypothetical protein
MKSSERTCSCNNQKQTVLWTVYHTILAILMAMVVAIEFVELMIYLKQIKGI